MGYNSRIAKKAGTTEQLTRPLSRLRGIIKLSQSRHLYVSIFFILFIVFILLLILKTAFQSVICLALWGLGTTYAGLPLLRADSLRLRLTAQSTQASVSMGSWFPKPGIRLRLPPLGARFLTTGPQGRPLKSVFNGIWILSAEPIYFVLPVLLDGSNDKRPVLGVLRLSPKIRTLLSIQGAQLLVTRTGCRLQQRESWKSSTCQPALLIPHLFAYRRFWQHTSKKEHLIFFLIFAHI